MSNYVGNIEQESLDNDNFRKVLFTASHGQLVVMSLLPGEEIGAEVHSDVDQFIRVEKGEGKAVLDGEEASLSDGKAVLIKAGTNHNIINTGSDKMKLYTIYMPPEHRDGTVHATKAEAQADTEDHYR